MKAPKLTDLNAGATPPAPGNDKFKQAVKEQTREAAKTVRRTFSLEAFLSAHIDAVAAAMTQEQGKPVNASQALRAIIKRDMERAGQ